MIKRTIFVLALAFCSFCTLGQRKPALSVSRAIPVAKVWSGHPVSFDILTTDKFQYVCYYDSSRNMVIAQRLLNSTLWKYTTLPTTVSWDSHNYVRMTIDRNGFIHVSGNMHGVPLIYFKSSKPESIDEFEKLPMTGKNEDRVTYPVFFKDQKGDLYFQYRNGASGQGITYWNKYDADKKQWAGLFDTPFFDGEEEANSYMTDPKLGPDGYFYIVWMWRLTPIANTNHNLSCVRSKDLVHWENMRGDKITLPVKWRDNLPVVDPVGPWNGLINMSFQINWNKQNVPYISYHKFDNKGVSQLFLAKFEGLKNEGNWKIYQVSNWKDFTWELNLGGSLRNSVGITSVAASGNNELIVGYMHEKYGSGKWLVDETTMKVKKQLPATAGGDIPPLTAITIRKDFTEQRKQDNIGRFVMQWQTLPTNQDRPRPGPFPQPADLVVYELK